MTEVVRPELLDRRSDGALIAAIPFDRSRGTVGELIQPLHLGILAPQPRARNLPLASRGFRRLRPAVSR